ncbi:hypothetical protein ACP70R_011466 [Stipagrostis hirtigluma subsp. patula]
MGTSHMAASVVAALGCLLPFLLLAVASGYGAYDGSSQPPQIDRTSFPEGFIFGAASAAYQYEGAAMEGGRGPSIWDSFTHQHPEKIADGSNGDVAVGSYHLYKEDVRLVKGMGMDAYRFSISWSRILPNGSLSGGINSEGVRYYNSLIDEILQQGVQPFVTLFHWDLPQALEDKYGGFLSPNIINDYKNYAEVCFKEFGDRVKQWITFNEPWTFCSSGYASGISAPGRCSPWELGKCSAGDSGREPYTACHHQLLAHAETVRLYKENYQAFMDPLTRGDYPVSMRALVGNRLPQFTKEQSELLLGAFDFIGLNYYTSNYAEDLPPSNGLNISYNTDSRANLTGVRNGVPIGPPAASPWLYIYPQGFRELLLYIKENYGNPTIYITENGVDEFNNKSLPLHEALKDDTRIEYHHNHLLSLLNATRDGANVKGYFAWSLLDNFEWTNGYTVRFGIHFVDYNDGLKRYPKNSAHWFTEFLQK